MEPINIEFILRSDIEKDIEKVKMAIQSTGNVSYNAFHEMLDASDEAFRSMSAGSQQQVRALQKLMIELQANQDAQSSLKKKFEEGQISVDAYTKAMSRLSLYGAEVKSSIGGIEQQLTREIQANKLVEGSYNQKIQKLKELKEAYKDLDEAERNDESIGKKMMTDIKSLTTEVGALDEKLKGVQSTMDSQTSINGMKDSLSNLEKQYNSLSKEQRNNAAVGGVMASQMRSLKGEIANAETAHRGLLESLRNAPGALGSAVSGIEDMTRAAMRFIMTPIGAVIAAVAGALMLLKEWFNRTQDGQMVLTQATAVYTQVLNILLNAASKLGSSLYKVFSDPVGAINDLGNLIKDQIINRFLAIGDMGAGVGKIIAGILDPKLMKEGLAQLNSGSLDLITGVKNTQGMIAQNAEQIKKRVEIETNLVALKREESTLTKTTAQNEAKMQELLTKATDISIPAKKRNAIIKEGLYLIDKTAGKEVDLARRKAQLTRDQMVLSYGSLNKLSLENQQTLDQLDVAVYQAQVRLEDKRRAFQGKANTIFSQDNKNNVLKNQKIDIELFQEGLAKKKTEYQRFYALMAVTSKTDASNAYSDLTQGGDSYLQYLEKQIQVLKDKSKTGALSPLENNELAALSTEKINLTGTKSPVDALKRDMEAKKKLYGEDLAAYKRYLEEKKKAASEDTSDTAPAQQVVIDAELERVNDETQRQLDALLEKYQTSMTKITSLQKDYNSDMKTLEEARQKALTTGNKEQVSAIDNAMQARTDAYKSAITSMTAEDSSFYSVLFGNLQEYSTKSLQQAIANAKSFLEQYKNGLDKDGNKISADTQQLLIKITKGVANAEQSVKDKLPDNLKKTAQGLSELSALVSVFDAGLADTIQTAAQLADGAADIAKGIASFSTDPVAAIGSVISGVTKIVNVFAAARESAIKARKEIEDYNFNQAVDEYKINELYRERLLTAQQIGETSLAYNERITAELKKQQQQISTDTSSLLAKLQGMDYISGMHTEKYGGFLGIGQKTKAVNDYNSMLGMTYEQIEQLYNSDKLDGKAKTLFEQLQKIKEEGVNVNQQLADQAEAMREAYTGTTTDAITGSIISGFQNGYKSAADFSANFEDMMKKAMLQAVQMQMLDEPMRKWYESFAASMQHGTLDKDLPALKKQYDNTINQAYDYLKSMEQVTGISVTDAGAATQTAQQKGIESITEDTGNKLEGHFAATRVNTGKTADNTAACSATLAKSLLSLVNIEKNTNELYRLETIQTVLSRLETDGVKLKK